LLRENSQYFSVHSNEVNIRPTRYESEFLIAQKSSATERVFPKTKN